MNQKSFLFGLAGIAIVLIILLLFSIGDQHAKVPEKYVVGQELCEEKICVTPISISEDRMTAKLLVYSKDANRTCLQNITNGVLAQLTFYDCREGRGWNGEKISSGPIIVN